MKKISLLIIWICLMMCFISCDKDSAMPPDVLLDGEVITALDLYVGQSLLLASSECENPVWSVSDSAVAQIQQDGTLTALAEGSTTLVLTDGKRSGAVDITVGPYIAVEEIMIKTERIIVKAEIPKNLHLTCLPEDASDKTLVYSVEPADGIVRIEDGVAYVSADAVAGTVYKVSAVNPSSGVSANFEIEISGLRGLTVWTIGDSIFDFRDEHENDVVQTMLREAGFTNFYMDNIAGATVRPASGVSIVEHMDSGMYARWPEPEVIILFRGTNDCYFQGLFPDLFTNKTIKYSVDKVCAYFAKEYPDARIIWATPLWRADVSEELLEWMREVLHTTCEKYGIEVFDIHLTEKFAELESYNYNTVLYDGIHPTDLGAKYMKDAFVSYLKGETK